MRNFCNAEWDRITPRRIDDREDEIKQISGSVDIETPTERKARRAIVKAKFQELIKDLQRTNIYTSMRK